MPRVAAKFFHPAAAFEEVRSKRRRVALTFPVAVFGWVRSGGAIRLKTNQGTLADALVQVFPVKNLNLTCL
jgi:hypothetical protein